VIAGLRYVPDYIDQPTHDRLLASADQHPWRMSVDHNVQVYGYSYNHQRREAIPIGDVPAWAMPLAIRLQQDGHIASTPNQLVVNEYQPGAGIFEHQDQDVFGDTVISVSLGSTCAMRFTRTEPDAAEELLLDPKSLLVLTGESRWNWKHGIPARQSDVWNGREHVRSRRVSLTFRAIPVRVPQ